jgi:hypothetical protein
MANIQQPLTPPPTQTPTHYDLPIFSLDELYDINNDDSDVAVKKYLELLCPDLQFDDLLNKYNRVSIPIEEDWRLLRQLKKALKDARLSDDPEGAQKVVMQELRDLQPRRVEAEKRFQDARPEFSVAPFPLPAWALGKWHDLLRGRHLLGMTNFICDVMPLLLEKLNSAESGATANLSTVATSSLSQEKKSLTSGKKQNPLAYAGRPEGITKKRRRMPSLQPALPRKSPRLVKK